MKEYCTQNNGDCKTCSIQNYGRDCMNNPIWGGKREGAGRPPTGRKARKFNLNDEEFEKVKKYVDEIRKKY